MSARSSRTAWVIILPVIAVWWTQTGVKPAAAEKPQRHVAKNEPQLLQDRYMAIFIDRMRCGYVHLKTIRQDQTITTNIFMNVSVSRAGLPLAIRTREITRETVSGRPIGFELYQKFAGTTVKKTGKIEQGKLLVTTTVAGRSRTERLPFDTEALFPYALQQRLEKLRLETGKRHEVLCFSPSLGLKPVRARIEIKGREQIQLLGRHVQARRVEMTFSKPAGIKTISWLDEATGEELKSIVPMGGLEMMMVACDRSFARSPLQPAEIIANSLVRPDRKIPRPRQLIRAVYRLRAVKGLLPALPSGPAQQPQQQLDGSVLLTVTGHRCRPADFAGKRPTPLPPRLRKKLTAATAMMDCSDEKIIELARKAIGNETDPWKRAKLLRSAVHKTIAKRSLGVGQASASEVVRRREGDCTEHAVLLAAAARAAGLPTRLAVGLLYVENFAENKGVFGYHMWIQAYIAGHWVDLDATTPTDVFDATHICLYVQQDDPGRQLQPLVALVKTFNNLKIEVKQLRYGGLPRGAD